LAYLDRNGLERPKIKLIVNRYNPHAGLSREAIETALQASVYDVLPNDSDAVQTALVEGKPISSGSSLGKALTALAERLAGRPAQPKKASLLAGRFSLFGLR
jgi:Flp pilus assembly CpaE family ATPase